MSYRVAIRQALCTWTTVVLIAAGFSTLRAAEPSIVAPAAGDASDRLGPATATRYRVGARITARGGTVQNIRVMVAVPLECDEQQVQIVEENISPVVETVDYRVLDGNGARQMLITIPQLSPRQSAEAIVTYEVLTHTILPPKDTAGLTKPARPDRHLKIYLSSAPYIEVGNAKIRAAVREALAAKKEKPTEEKEKSGDGDATAPSDPENADAEDAYEEAPASAAGEKAEGAAPKNDADSIEPAAEKPIIDAASPGDAHSAEELTDWQTIEKFYDYARERVQYEEGVDKSAVQALREGRGDCQAIGALFVAMCRTEDVPARLVWVDGHQYAEFYLEHAKGEGRWYPVETAGGRAFGEMPLARVILQKGDNFRVPERRRERLRYASDYALFLSSPTGKPKVEYIREKL